MRPTWQVWEYSSSWSARIAQATDDFDVVDAAESPEDVTSALDDVADAISELAEEKRESASNIEEGFGHATSQSEEAEQRADDLDGWADEIEQADIPDLPEVEERYFVTNGDGVVSDLFEEDGYDTETDAEHALDHAPRGRRGRRGRRLRGRGHHAGRADRGAAGRVARRGPDAVSIVDESPV